MKLYYYTGHEFLRKILQDRKVKLSRYGRFGSLNDPFEQAAYDISNQGFRKAHKRLTDKFAQTQGLICLSETRHSPAMWAHYTDNHEGACLEIEVTFDHIFKVKYRTKKLFQGLSLENFSSHVNADNIKKIWGTKSKNWSYEKEQRMHVPLNDKVVIKEGEHYFLPFQEVQDNTFLLKRVFVGYRCSEGISNIMDDVKDYPHKVEVIQTRPAFKSFKVVKQIDKKHWNMEQGQRGKEDSLPAVRAVFGN
jgi:hypothetical protein